MCTASALAAAQQLLLAGVPWGLRAGLLMHAAYVLSAQAALRVHAVLHELRHVACQLVDCLQCSLAQDDLSQQKQWHNAALTLQLPCRAIGDEVAATVGCTARPTVRHKRLQPGDTYLVVASDGVWDVLTNEQVCCRCCCSLQRTLHKPCMTGQSASLVCAAVRVEQCSDAPHSSAQQLQLQTQDCIPPACTTHSTASRLVHY